MVRIVRTRWDEPGECDGAHGSRFMSLDCRLHLTRNAVVSYDAQHRHPDVTIIGTPCGWDFRENYGESALESAIGDRFQRRVNSSALGSSPSVSHRRRFAASPVCRPSRAGRSRCSHCRQRTRSQAADLARRHAQDDAEVGRHIDLPRAQVKPVTPTTRAWPGTENRCPTTKPWQVCSRSAAAGTVDGRRARKHKARYDFPCCGPRSTLPRQPPV